VETAVLNTERRRASNQSRGAARQSAHDRGRARVPYGWRSDRAGPLAAPVRHGAHSPPSVPACSSSIGQEAFHLEGSFSFEHEVDGASELVGEDGERLSLSVFSLEALAPFLQFVTFPQHEEDRFAEGPAEMSVADLGPAGSRALAGGCVRAFHEACVRGEVLDSREAVDVVDLVENRQGEDLSDAGDGTEPVEVVGVVNLDVLGEEAFEIADDLIEPVGEGEVDGDVLLDAAVGEGIGGAGAVRAVSELDGRGGEIVLMVSVLDVGDELASLKGRTAWRKRSGSVRRLRWSTVFPSRSRTQTYIDRACRSTPQ